MDQFAFYNKTTALRIGLTPLSTLTSSNTTLPGNLTLPGPLIISGTSAGTNLQLINSTTVTSGTTTTLAYAGLGVTPGTALENYALTGHRWWTGSSGTTSGTTAMQLSATSLTLGNSSVTTALQFAGTTAGTLLQLNNTIATVSGTVTTTAYGALGVTPGTALERYALTAHRWWTGSSGTTSGTVGMQLTSGGLSLSTLTTSGDVIVGGLSRQPNAYSLSLRGNGGSLAVNSTTAVNISTYFPTQANVFPSAAAWTIGSTITIPKTGIYMASTYVYTVPSAPANNNFEVYLMYLSVNGTNVANMGLQTTFGQGIYLPLQGSFYAAAGAVLGFSIQTVDATETIQFLNSTLFQLSLIVPM